MRAFFARTFDGQKLRRRFGSLCDVPPSTHFLYVMAEGLARQQRTTGNQLLRGPRHPELPREAEAVVAQAPSQWRAQRLPHAAPGPRVRARGSSDLVVEQEELEHAPKAPQFIALKPRQHVRSELQVIPFFQRLRLAQ